MGHIIIQIPKNLIEPEDQYVLRELRKALETEKLIVLDFGKEFFYNSNVISMILLNRKRIVIIGCNDRFKNLVNILNIGGLICIFENMEDFLGKCSKLGMEGCCMCESNK